jgi:anti-sigma factor RsiW
MTCREALNLLPLFLDGELEPRQMRALAMHSSRCTPCESQLRQLERLQEVVSESMSARVDELDLSNFWPSIEQRLGNLSLPWWQRLRAWWADSEYRWMVSLPAFAAAAAIAVLAMMFFLRGPQATTDPAAPQVAAVDNAASIDSLDTDVDSVAVLSDPETRTTVLWVSDDTVLGDAP